MARLPNRSDDGKPDRDDIKAALVDVPAVLDTLGQEYRRESSCWKISCPHHAERSGSCSVSNGPDGTLRYRCFGCGATGDVFTLIAAVRGLDVQRDFAAVLMEGAQIAGWRPGVDPPPRPRRPAPPPLPPFPSALCDDIVRRWPAGEDRDVSTYLARRGLLEACGGKWAALPAGPAQPEAVRYLVDRWGIEALREIGIGHVCTTCPPDCRRVVNYGSHRLIIPWRAPGVAGEIATIQRRVITPIPEGSRCPRYVFPSKRSPVDPYGIEDAIELLGDGAELAVTEGAFDAEAFKVLSVIEGKPERAVVGLPGCSGWRSRWAVLGKGTVAIIALDEDPAGDAATEKIAADLLEAGAVRVIRARPSKAKDWAAALERRAA